MSVALTHEAHCGADVFVTCCGSQNPIASMLAMTMLKELHAPALPFGKENLGVQQVCGEMSQNPGIQRS